MNSEGEYKTLGEVVTLLSGNTPSKGNEKYWDGKYLWASAKDMKSFFISSTQDGLTEEGLEKVSKVVDAGTTLLLTRGMTLINDVPICVTTKKASFNQDLKAVISKDKTIEPEFIPYLLLGNKSRIHSLVDLAGHGTGRLATDTLLNLEVFIPNESDRKFIISLFSSLDKKIELNRQINQTLEQIAQAIFKSWFVDFEPVKARAQVRASAVKGKTPESGQNRINKKELEAEMNRAAMHAICGAVHGSISAAGAGSAGAAKTDKLDQLSPEQHQQLATTAALFPDELEDDAQGRASAVGGRMPGAASELGEIPAGWKVKPLDTIAEYLNGLALQKFPAEDDEESLPVIKIAQLKKGNTDSADRASRNIKPEYIIDNGDVIFSWSGSLFIDIWCGGKGALNQHLFKVSSDEFPKWFYFYWTNYHLAEFQRIAADKAVTMGHIKRGHLSAAMCLVPDEKLINSLGAYISTLVDLAVERRLENVNLSMIRDSLLPKLLTGEITDDNTQSTAEAVA